jgi:hypothetical protein
VGRKEEEGITGGRTTGRVDGRKKDRELGIERVGG